MQWLEYYGDGKDRARAGKALDELVSFFSKAELNYLMDNISGVFFERMPSDSAGYYAPETEEIVVNVSPEVFAGGLSPLPKKCQSKLTLTHELTHPLLMLAAQDCLGGFFLVNENMRKVAQERARVFAPKAIAAVEEVLSADKNSTTYPDWTKFSTKERVAAELYFILDERYYDIFGDAIRAKKTGVGYTAPNRHHEIGCNLRGLLSVESDITGKPAHIVNDLAGDILQMIDTKIEKSLSRNPNRPPLKKAGPSGQGPTGQGSAV